MNRRFVAPLGMIAITSATFIYFIRSGVSINVRIFSAKEVRDQWLSSTSLPSLASDSLVARHFTDYGTGGVACAAPSEGVSVLSATGDSAASDAADAADPVSLASWIVTAGSRSPSGSDPIARSRSPSDITATLTENSVASPTSSAAVFESIPPLKRRTHEAFPRTAESAPGFASIAEQQNKPVSCAESLTTEPTLRSARIAYVTSYVGIGRLGNNMFLYASTLGVSLRHDLQVVFRLTDWQLKAYEAMRSVFRLSVRATAGEFKVDKWLVEKGWARYTDAFENSRNFGNRTFLVSYLQSFKYFEAYKPRIKQEFTLTERYEALANEFLGRAAAGRPGVTFVGVHVRRGDMVNRKLYNVAPRSYIGSAMDYFVGKYGASAQILFVVASDGLEWVSASLSEMNRTSDVVFTRSSAEGDMAILSRCNHSIITSGTFGWWTGYLTGGDVLYYKEFMPASSPLSAGYTPDDYYPPHWIGLS